MNKLFFVFTLLCSPMMAGDRISCICGCNSARDCTAEEIVNQQAKPLTIRWVKVKPMLGPVCLAYWSKEGIDGVPKGMGGKCSHTAENPSDDYMGNAIQLGLRSDGIVVWK
ncbi:MAG: hypothetical protein ACHQUC_08420 [Chlamydiales bacterium]